MKQVDHYVHPCIKFDHKSCCSASAIPPLRCFVSMYLLCINQVGRVGMTFRGAPSTVIPNCGLYSQFQIHIVWVATRRRTHARPLTQTPAPAAGRQNRSIHYYSAGMILHVVLVLLIASICTIWNLRTIPPSLFSWHLKTKLRKCISSRLLDNNHNES